MVKRYYKIIVVISFAFVLLCALLLIVFISQDKNRFYGGSGDERLATAIKSSRGGYLLAGTTESNDLINCKLAGKSDVYLVKTDSYGQVEWETTYGYKRVDVVQGVFEVVDVGYMVYGWTHENAVVNIGTGAKPRNCFIAHFDYSGRLEFDKVVGNNNYVNTFVTVHGNLYNY